MDCRDAVYSEDYFELIAEYGIIPGVAEDSLCVQNINEQYDIHYVKRAQGQQISVNTFSYLSIPKCYTQLDESALEESGITRIQNQPTLSLKGQGVLIGFIDSGERVIIMSS
ncbi:hypothetical protein LQZ18_00845 [Lachnospiraceae bacterium ZAX-1]